MPRFFTLPENIQGDHIYLYQDDVNHIVHVLRLAVGDSVTICDSRGMDYYSSIEKITGSEVVLRILSQEKSTGEPVVSVTLYQGLPKLDKMELIIQKCVELGVHRIVPVATERSVAKVTGKEEKKLSRWQKISEAAAKQSGRGIVPVIGPVMRLEEAVADMDNADLALMPYELDRRTTVGEVLEGFGGRSLSVIIGPEGGFSPREYEQCLEGGLTPVSLGKRILRTETAGFVTLTLIMHILGEL